MESSPDLVAAIPGLLLLVLLGFGVVKLVGWLSRMGAEASKRWQAAMRNTQSFAKGDELEHRPRERRPPSQGPPERSLPQQTPQERQPPYPDLDEFDDWDMILGDDDEDDDE